MPADLASSSKELTMSVESLASSVAEFIHRLNVLPHNENIIRTFRGEANTSWSFKPGIMRAGRERLLKHEKDTVREIVSIHPDQFSEDQTMFDRLVRMQHFGLPTRLMDMTGNPLVALYNASAISVYGNDEADGRVFYMRVPRRQHKYFDSDTVSCLANIANLTSDEKLELWNNRNISIKRFNDSEEVPACDRLLQFIRAEKPSFRPLINPAELTLSWYVVPKMSNRRIIAQNGAFIIFGLSDQMQHLDQNETFATHTVVIPAAAKRKIREDLELLGISERSLFPEIDKAATHILRKFSAPLP